MEWSVSVQVWQNILRKAMAPKGVAQPMMMIITKDCPSATPCFAHTAHRLKNAKCSLGMTVSVAAACRVRGDVHSFRHYVLG
jgi:hypothetical protein